MEPTIKQVREMENNACHGGMRSPHRAKCVTSDKALALGKLLRQSILKAIRKDTSLLEQAVDMLQGKPCSMTPHLPKGLRADLAKILRVKPPADKGISPEFIKGFCDLSGDPDEVLAEWRMTGAPLGIINEITATGIFPKVEPAESTMDPLQDIASSPQGWANYKSAEESPDTKKEILTNMVKEEWAIQCDTWQQVVDAVGSDQITLSKLALISKQRSGPGNIV
jgi:hypothetical protein